VQRSSIEPRSPADRPRDPTRRTDQACVVLGPFRSTAIKRRRPIAGARHVRSSISPPIHGAARIERRILPAAPIEPALFSIRACVVLDSFFSRPQSSVSHADSGSGARSILDLPAERQFSSFDVPRSSTTAGGSTEGSDPPHGSSLRYSWSFLLDLDLVSRTRPIRETRHVRSEISADRVWSSRVHYGSLQVIEIPRRRPDFSRSINLGSRGRGSPQVPDRAVDASSRRVEQPNSLASNVMHPEARTPSLKTEAYAARHR